MKLQICKYTSKIVYSRKKIYTTLYLKLTRHAEYSSRWCKMSYRHLKLKIVIAISNQSSDKRVEQAQKICSSKFSLFLSRILEVVFSSLRYIYKDIFLHVLSDVKFQIATFQKKSMICKRSLLRYDFPCLPLKIFKLLNKSEER